MMADLVRDHIGLGEIAGRGEALRELAEEGWCRDRCAGRPGSRTAPSRESAAPQPERPPPV